MLCLLRITMAVTQIICFLKEASVIPRAFTFSPGCPGTPMPGSPGTPCSPLSPSWPLNPG
uniref:Uncharacterized protein n=1 Tax=Neogobius melanostomus TaxID=47308 RepID=A0A8C6WNQ9_9GOBI